MYDFVVADSFKLVTPIILGVDFLQQNGLVLDFTCTAVMAHKGLPNAVQKAAVPVALTQVIHL